MRRILFFIYLLFAGPVCFSQQGPVYGQYFHNPFLYNPGFAGTEKVPVLALTHQRQLLGVEEAPVASTLVFHTPLFNKFAIGTKIYTESQGLLSSSSAQIALVYVLPVNRQTDIRFGLAGGITKNQMDLSSATESQLSYLSGLNGSFNQADIRFGVVWNSQNLKAGVSFPNMTKRNLLSYTSYQPVEIDPFEHVVFTGSFRMDLVPGRLLLEPLLIYERFNRSQEQRIEAGSLLYLRNLVWVGGTYQYQSGISGLLGIQVKERISFGYAYEMTSGVSNYMKNASHEVQLKIKLGKEREAPEEPKRHLPRFEQ